MFMMKSKFSQNSDTEFTKKTSRPSFGEQLQKIIEDTIQANKEKMQREAEEENYPQAELIEDIQMMENSFRRTAERYIANWPGIQRIIGAIKRKYGQSFSDSILHDIFDIDKGSTFSPEYVVYLVIETEKMCHQSGLEQSDFREKFSRLAHHGIAAMVKELEEKEKILQAQDARIKQLEAMLHEYPITDQSPENSTDEKVDGKWVEFTRKLDSTKKRDAAEAEIDNGVSADRKQPKQGHDEQSTSSDDEKVNSSVQTTPLRN
jgi:hypothetical protein